MLIRIVDNNVLRNNLNTIESIKDALHIWGESTLHLKGKTTRRGEETVELGVHNIIPLPPYIIKDHQNILLGIDVTIINNIPFLNTISRVVRHGSAQKLIKSDIVNVLKQLKVVLAM